MKLKGTSPAFTVVVTVLIFNLVGQAFAAANGLLTPWMMYLFVLVVSLLIVSPLPWFLKYPLEFAALVVTCFSYFSYDLNFSWRWVRFFSLNTFIYLHPNYQESLTYLPENLALVIFLLGFLILINLILVYGVWQTTYVFALSYLVMLVISNGTNLTIEIVLVSVLGLILAVSLRKFKLNPLVLHWQDLLILTTIVFFSLSAWYFPQVFPSTQQKIVAASQRLKKTAEQSRWYQLLRTDHRGGISQLGFSENDEVLGGPVRTGQGTAFEALTTQPYYWQVGVKDLYTGQGWQSSQTVQHQITSTPFVLDTFLSGYETAEPITISLLEAERFIPRPSGRVFLSLSEDFLESETLQFSPVEERLYLDLENLETVAREFELLYYAPSYTLGDLERRQARYDGPEPEIMQQLPAELPQRVRELAEEITARATTDYQRVKAIERYLKIEGEFTYSLSEARQLPIGRDYVDYFLFDYPVGYCEHFSTAMVVLVRSLGLPARWSKGFSEGEYIRKIEDGRSLYEVGNRHAHTWPEVYFEGIGWVPFEPTKSFTNTAQGQLLATAAEDVPEAPTPLASSTLASTLETSSQSLETTPVTPQAEKGTGAKVNRLILAFVTGLVVAVSAFLLFLYRERLAWAWLLWKINWLPYYSFERSLTGLLKRLNRCVSPQPNQTLQEYYDALLSYDTRWQESLTQVFRQGELSYYGPPAKSVGAKAFLPAYVQLRQVALTNKKSDGTFM